MTPRFNRLDSFPVVKGLPRLFLHRTGLTSALYEIEKKTGWSRIARVNGQRTVTVRGDVDALQTNAVKVIAQLEREFLPQLAERYPEIVLSYEGEIKEMRTTQASMRRSMLIGVIGVFVLLSFQFRSYIEPLIVMAAIPFALIGVTAGHYIMGIDNRLLQRTDIFNCSISRFRFGKLGWSIGTINDSSHTLSLGDVVRDDKIVQGGTGV